MWRIEQQVTLYTKIAFKISAVFMSKDVDLIKHVFGHRGKDYEWIGTVVAVSNDVFDALRVDMGNGVVVYVHASQVRVRSCGE